MILTVHLRRFFISPLFRFIVFLPAIMLWHPAVSQVSVQPYSGSRLEDKSHVFTAGTEFYYSCPADSEALKKTIKYASEHSLKVRIRGRGHSASGNSLPQEGELLVMTDSLGHISMLSDSVVRVEAGVVMYDCKLFLNEAGLDLYTCNEGGPGPTLGGYISAGGIGAGDEPGFWSHVLRMFVVDGEGQLHVLERSDPDFLWIFGSMGQLGVIYAADLEVKKLEQDHENDAANDFSAMINYHYYWYPFKVSQSQSQKFDSEIKKVVAGLNKKYEDHYQPDDVEFMMSGIMNVKQDGPNPPLIYNRDSAFCIIGLKVLVKKSLHGYKDLVEDIRNEAIKLFEKYRFPPYFQVSYYALSPAVLKRYLGADVYNGFYTVKKRYDPAGLFQPDFFPKD